MTLPPINRIARTHQQEIERLRQESVQRPPRQILTTTDARGLLPPSSRDGWLYHAGAKIPLCKAHGHSLKIGGTGSGKTQLLDREIKSILPYCRLGSKNKLVIIDLKGTVLQLLHGEGYTDYTYFNPFDERSSKWDVFTDFGEDLGWLGELAHKIIPKRNSGEVFFPEAARAFLKALLASLVTVHKTPSLFHLYQLLQVPYSQLEEFLKRHPANWPYLQMVHRTVQPKTAAGILAELHNNLDRFVPLFANDAYATKRFSVTEFCHTGGVLVLGMDLTRREVSEPVLHLLLDTLFDRLFATPDSEVQGRGWLVLDELGFLGTISQLPRVLSFARSKGWDVAMALQSVTQLNDLYEPGEVAAITGNCSHITLLNNNCPETNRWAVSLFGEEAITETQISQGLHSDGSPTYSESEQQVVRNRFTLGSLAALSKPTPATGIECYLLSTYLPSISVNPFHIPPSNLNRYTPQYDTTIPAFIPKLAAHAVPPAPSKAQREWLVSGSETNTPK